MLTIDPIPPSFRENGTWLNWYEQVRSDDDNLESWEQLIAATEPLKDESSSTTAKIFDSFLTKFPLLFAYWTKYANLQLHKEESKVIYQRAVSAFPNSIDLWVQYIEFMLTKYYTESKPVENLRLLFEHGADLVGRDFLAHPFWDKYIEFEESIQPNSLELAKILARVIQYPLHQYARYFEKFSIVVNQGKISYDQVFSEPVLAKVSEKGINSVFMTTQAKTNDRWTYESQITRNYFHIIELEANQLKNWHQYLGYLEDEAGKTIEYGSEEFEDIRAVYERALVPAALYDSFWQRYVRWLTKFLPESEEECRNVYRRATTIFIPSTKPMLKFQWAIFEESLGKLDLAKDVLNTIASDNESNTVKDLHVFRVRFEKRHGGTPKALEYIDKELASSSTFTKPILMSLKATIYWRDLKDVAKAADIYKNNISSSLSSRFFCVNYFQFLLQTHTSEDELYELWKVLTTGAKIPIQLIRDISHEYLEYLAVNGSKNSMKRYMEVDVETNGPFSVQKNLKLKTQR